MCLSQTERSPLKRSVPSRTSQSVGSSSSNLTTRRPSLHTVGDVVSPASTSRWTGPWSSPSRGDGVVALPRCLERLLAVDSVAVRLAMDRSLVKVHLANGCFNVFKCSDSTTVKVCPHFTSSYKQCLSRH